MKLNAPRTPHVGPASLFLGVALIVGCETLDESKYEGIGVSPTYASCRLGESVTFTASGGYDYHWSLANSSYGSLSATQGESVQYTVRKIPVGADFTQTITLSGRLPNDAIGVGGTNGTPQTAEARVNHGSPSDDVTSDDVTITAPDTASIAGAPVKLTASGGDGVSYSWSISENAIGFLSGTEGPEVSYKAESSTNATQTVRVSSGGSSDQVVIIHVP